MFVRRPNSSLHWSFGFVRAWAVFSLVLSACGGILWAAAPATKSHEARGVRIELPSDWEVFDDKESVISAREHTTTDPTDTVGGFVRLKAHLMTERMTLDQLLQVQENDARTNFNTLGKGELTGGKHRILWLAVAERTINKNSGLRLAKTDYYFLKGTTFYALLCFTPVDRYEEYRPQFEQIAKSILLPEVSPAPPLTEREKNLEGAATIGYWTSRLICAVIIVWGGAALIRRIARGRKSVSEL